MLFRPRLWRRKGKILTAPHIIERDRPLSAWSEVSLTSGAIKKVAKQLWASLIKGRLLSHSGTYLWHPCNNLDWFQYYDFFRQYWLSMLIEVLIWKWKKKKKCYQKYTVSNKTGAPSPAVKVIEFPTISVKRKPEFGASRLSWSDRSKRARHKKV